MFRVKTSLVDFTRRDHRRAIFPLRASFEFLPAGEKDIRDDVQSKVFDKDQIEGFSTATVAYARKDAQHLRRVLVLDPVSSFFLYDFVASNSAAFQLPKVGRRCYFGHSFRQSRPVDAFKQYHGFRTRKYNLKASSRYFAKVDIFNCFNSFYHHKVVNWLASKTTTDEGVRFGQYLREINGGDSVGCFPQGLYPAKVIGNAYLSFVEGSRELKARNIIRFLDDIILFSNSRRERAGDLVTVQHLLDNHHLALNDSKTLLGERGTDFDERRLDDIKKGLVQKREKVPHDYDDDGEEEKSEGEEDLLSDEELEYLMDLIAGNDVAQEDVELALSLLRHHPPALEPILEQVTSSAPHLLRELHRFIGDSEDDGEIWAAITPQIRKGSALDEHDLFWYAKILIDYFDFDQDIADQLIAIYQHQRATTPVKALILETPYLDHGFTELKETALRSNPGPICTASVLLGLKGLEKSKRNQLFKYVTRQGAMLGVLAEIAARI